MAADCLFHLLSKSQRIMGRMPACVVVEIGEDGLPFAQSIGKPACPSVQRIVVVPTTVSYGTVEPRVDDGADRAASGRGVSHVVNAARDSASRKKFEDLVGIPTRIAELDHMRRRFGKLWRKTESRSTSTFHRGGNW